MALAHNRGARPKFDILMERFSAPRWILFRLDSIIRLFLEVIDPKDGNIPRWVEQKGTHMMETNWKIVDTCWQYQPQCEYNPGKYLHAKIDSSHECPRSFLSSEAFKTGLIFILRKTLLIYDSRNSRMWVLFITERMLPTSVPWKIKIPYGFLGSHHTRFSIFIQKETPLRF